MIFKEEREYKMIEDKLIYKVDQKKWEVGYLWIKDFKVLLDNKEVVFAILKVIEKRFRQNSVYVVVYRK